MRQWRAAVLAVLLAGLLAGCDDDDPMNPGNVILQQGDAVYDVTFQSTWSAATHPANFPPNPHFSRIVAASHNANVTFWAAGALATTGIKDMAEMGSVSPLDGEIDAAIGSGDANQRIVAATGLGTSPGSQQLAIVMVETHPLVTLVTMVAPSPDWFVGVSGLDLRPNNAWVDSVTVQLFAHDAGTDNGVTYDSANEATVPPVPVTRIQVSPFLVNATVVPVGTLTFTRR